MGTKATVQEIGAVGPVDMRDFADEREQRTWGHHTVNGFGWYAREEEELLWQDQLSGAVVVRQDGRTFITLSVIKIVYCGARAHEYKAAFRSGRVRLYEVTPTFLDQLHRIVDYPARSIHELQVKRRNAQLLNWLEQQAV